MTKEQLAEFTAEFGKEAALEMKKLGEGIAKELNDKYASTIEGLMSAKDFEEFKSGKIKELNEKLDVMEKAAKTQGEQINELLKGNSGGEQAKSLDEFLTGLMPKIQEMRKAGAGFFEVTSSEMKKAGVKSFTGKASSIHTTGVGTVGGTDGSIVAQGTSAGGSPYLPGLGGSDLELFDIVRNPNFILNRVDVGRTNQSRLAWINEVEFAGTVSTTVAEGTAKPLVQHKFQVEFSTAKKAAAYIVLTEEFEDDVPGLATAVRRMLQQDVLRAFDDAIQTAVIAAARPFEITGLDGKVAFTTLFDAVGALLAQIGYYNFVPNTVALNPVTAWQMWMDKDSEGRYLNPPFVDRITRLLVEATKVAVGYGLAGDLTQYKVDIYKDFTLRVGWINDDLIKNQFCVVGELRYHNYISDNRKKAIVYNQLAAVQSKITAGS